MSSFDKTVKLACKPKAAAPKSKYLDPIIAATWSDEGAVHDVCKALVSRIREPNAVVVFKALIVLHTMIRAGATDNVLGYLSSSNILKLRNVSSANWEGYAAPQNLQNYALYLESRILAYKELKHDAIKVQSESNRDMRNSIYIGENSQRGRKDRKTDAPAPARSKTIAGRKLRSMTVEKGLLRETKVVHRMIDSLVECRFYLDSLEDELTTTALQMLVKDLLILFQAGNEGVINVLERYFEMSHVDAEDALKLYRRFCKQTENVVEYVGVARKLQNILNVPVPNLKHAPVSLAGLLQEYLDDPSFEQNRTEYKMNKETVERGTKSKAGKKFSESATVGNPSSSPPEQALSENLPSTSSAPSTSNMDGRDFFSSIEEEQLTNLSHQTNSPNMIYFQQQEAANPFTRMLGAQPTGFLLPQATAVPAQPNPFSNFFTQSAHPTGQHPLSSFTHQQPIGILQVPQHPQPTGLQVSQLLQPQMTGPNPFRQSMLVPQTTGMQLFGVPPVPSLQQSQTMMNLGQTSTGLSPVALTPFSAPKPSFGPISSVNDIVPARPSSTPLTSSTATTASSTLQPVKTHQTGTKNPFGPVSAPPVPKPPTLFELSTGLSSQSQNQNQHHAGSLLQQTLQNQHPPQTFGSNPFNFTQSSLNPGATDISSVASSFTFANGKLSSTANSTNTKTTTTTGPDGFFPTVLPSQPTGVANTSRVSATTTSTTPFTTSSVSTISPVQSHLTGFAGLKPFKPTSSFGASLLESLPAITGSEPTTPTIPGNTSANSSAIPKPSNDYSTAQTNMAESSSATGYNPPSSSAPFLNNQHTGVTGGFGTRSFGSTLGVGLRPQLTGGGGANPFRASMAASAFGNTAVPAMPHLPMGLGMQAFGGMGGSGIKMGTQNQPNAATSLI